MVTCPKCEGKFHVPIPTAYAGQGPYFSSQTPEVQAFASKKIAAGLCGILLGALGIHKFILGLTTSGVIMLLVSIIGACLYLPTLAMAIIGLIEGIIYLTKSDEEFYKSYAVQKKEWF